MVEYLNCWFCKAYEKITKQSLEVFCKEVALEISMQERVSVFVTKLEVEAWPTLLFCNDMSHGWRCTTLKVFNHQSSSRSSRPEVFSKKGVLRNFAKFAGKHLCQRLFFNKVAGLYFFIPLEHFYYRTPPVAASDSFVLVCIYHNHKRKLLICLK